MCGSDSANDKTDCGEAFDRGRSNRLLQKAGFWILTEGPKRPRVQCFNSQRLADCRPQPGANFRAPDRFDQRWLFNHKGLNLFLASRARGANRSTEVCQAKAWAHGIVGPDNVPDNARLVKVPKKVHRKQWLGALKQQKRAADEAANGTAR